MLKFLKIDHLNLRADVKNIPLINTIATLIFLGLAIILSTRDLGVAKDDYNYLNHFYYTRYVEGGNFLLYLIEEPLWRLYTSSITLIVQPENALRITLFISSALFLLCVNRVNVRLFLIVALVFVLHEDFATQMYFNQLRQGLALSLFLFFSIYGKRPLVGGILAVLIHSSFIFPLILTVLITRVDSIKWIIMYSLVGIMVLYLSVGLLNTLDLGRRTETYSFEGEFTVNFYIYTFVRYFPLLLLVQFYGYKNKYSFWYKLALVSFIIIVPFTLLHNAAGRLMYYVSAFFLLMILEQHKSLAGKLGLIYYLMFIMIEILFFESTVFSDWQLILRI